MKARTVQYPGSLGADSALSGKLRGSYHRRIQQYDAQKRHWEMSEWRMPPEWAEHAATWMGFPTGAYDTSGITDDDAFDAWSTVANSISEHEQVNMICHPDQISIATRKLSSAITLHPLKSTTPGCATRDQPLFARTAHSVALTGCLMAGGSHCL